MKAASIKELKLALKNRSQEELVELCLILGKFKKESKELLTYHLFEAADEEAYIQGIKNEMDQQFSELNTTRYYLMKKGIRKILTQVKKYIRYSKKKETEVELLLYFCKKMKRVQPSINRSTILKNLYQRQVQMIRKKVAGLHEDLQYDYGEELEQL